MPSVLDLTDKLVKFPIAYGYQPVKGWSIKHYDTVFTNNSQRTLHHALGEGPWDGVEGLWMDAFEIESSNYHFHPGIGTDTADAFFTTEVSHPWTAHISARAQAGLSEDQLTKLFGIYRTLRTPNYNGSGQQLNAAGGVVSPADPRDEYFFKPNPANVALDQLLRWGKRLTSIVNFPAWVDWRDYNDELIPWDDAAYTPRALSLTPTTGGSLTPGNTYYVRVATLKGADVSSGSMSTVETPANSITLPGGQTAFQVAWLLKGDEENPATPPAGVTGYRIYIGTVPNVWLGYFQILTPLSRSYLVTTTSGVTAGNPLDQATSGLLRQIKRFECGLFFHPPYDLASVLDRICQISCADWQWSGLGTGTYRNDKVRFMSPAGRSPVFTLNLAETEMGSFRTYPIDRRSRPNQIIVNFRDRDDRFLGEAQPVILDREQLQSDDGQVKTHIIEAGTIYRSQAQRIASFYARVLCDLDQMAIMKGSPKSYHVLPADVVLVTNETPDWENVEFIVRKKEETVETALGDLITAQLYSPSSYSDTDHSPLPSPLPTQQLDPFASPPLVENVVVVEGHITSSSNNWISTIVGNFDFADFHIPQRAYIYLRLEGEVDWNKIQTVFPGLDNKGFFEYAGIPNTTGTGHGIKIVSVSTLGQTNGVDSAQEYLVEILGPPAMNDPTVFEGFFDEIDGDLLVGWAGDLAIPDDLERYELEIRNLADTVLLRPTILVRPPLNRRLQEYVIWSPEFEGPGTTPPFPPLEDRADLLPNGGIFFPMDFTAVQVRSKASAEVVGGLLVEFQVPSNGIIMPFQIRMYPEDASEFDEASLQWVTKRDPYTAQGEWWVIPDGIDNVNYKQSHRAGDRLAIYIRPDAIAEYHINYTPANAPIYISGKPVDTSQKYMIIVFGGDDDSFAPEGHGVEKVMWERQGPEWKYIADAQKIDNSGSLPASVRMRVRQLSPWTNGRHSNWVSEVFVRP